MDGCMETHTQAPAEQPHLSKNYLIWQGGFCGGVFVTEQLFIGWAATGSLGVAWFSSFALFTLNCVV